MQAIVALFGFYETLFLIAAVIGVTYDICRRAVRSRTSVSDI